MGKRIQMMWIVEHHCIYCDNILTEGERLVSGGRCPHCGRTKKNSGGVVASYKKPYRWVRGWFGKKKEYKDD